MIVPSKFKTWLALRLLRLLNYFSNTVKDSVSNIFFAMIFDIRKLRLAGNITWFVSNS